MGQFLLAAVDGGGTIPPQLGVAADLIRRGHAVHVLADPTVEASARKRGCTFSPWRRAPHLDTVDAQTALIRRIEGGNPITQLRIARDEMLIGPARRFADDVISTVAEVRADALLVDWAVVGALIGAEATGLPTAALMSNVYVGPTEGMPQLGTGWFPGHGRLGRLRDAAVAAAVRRVWATTLDQINAALASYALEPTAEGFSLPNRCHRVLVQTSPSFDFPVPDLPPNVRYVGPQLDDPAWAEGDQWRPPGDAPLVLVAMSSVYQDQIETLRRIATALGCLPVRGLLTTGQAVDPADVPAPRNVRVVRSAPHREVLTEASAVVTHAGHGTVLKSLAAGVPLVCMPMGRDQRDNTVRVLRLGAGLRISKRERQAGIAAAVHRVLTKPGYRQAAERFAATLEFERAHYPTAADEAEGLLTVPRRSASFSRS